MTNTRNDFNLYHEFGQASPTVRKMRDYTRDWLNILPTLVAKVTSFAVISYQRYLILITSISAQSLIANSEDISTDSIINGSDYLAISET
ncbi:hypothetical protein TNCV_4159411 [Trichonephila clavipes]|nr:hypothetical protein TNCV_4159411 [Trichonephila clavipes]